jgi:soluble lytic murein transglycosylase-like protein
MSYHVRSLVAAVTGLVLAAGCGLGGKAEENVAAPVASEPVFEPVPESPSPSEAAPEPSPTSDSPSAEATSAAPMFWDELPACAHRDKTKMVARSKVKTALKSASARIYWRTEAPTLKLNYPLVKAVAWMESGWQSNIHNCDGGAGIMQVMPDTVSFINNRFGLDYDASKYQQNAYVGANYLAWMTRWAADRYFKKNYNLSASRCKSTTSWCLLNVVIAGYNAGQGGIEQAAESRTLPNPQYVSTVRALMTRCKCDQY